MFLLPLLVSAAALAPGALGHSGAVKSVPLGDVLPETGAIGPILPPKKCVYDVDDPRQKRFYEFEGWRAPDFERYPGACERLTFAHPVVVKPGQNDVMIEPVTIGKPLRDGYMTRFRPDLVAVDGVIPPVEDIHLHHGTWLNVAEPYGGTVAFLASGEEKTIASFPRGYGMPIKASDTWQLLYMVHSANPDPTLVWIIYEIDFVPKAAGDEIGITPAYPLWLDVRPSAYPVFNVMRSFGGKNNRCTWPRQQCASVNHMGETEVGQGMPGNGLGSDLVLAERGGDQGRMTNFTGGTILGLGGHLHPGGIKTDVDLVRRDRPTRIFTSKAKYWGHRNHHKANGPPTSWDMSMTVQGLPWWGVHVKPEDTLRINATYDTKHAATWENMGIVIGVIVPNDPEGRPQAPGVNPYKVKHVKNTRKCLRRGGIQAKNPVLCERGIVTHGSQPPNQNHSGPRGSWPDPPEGPVTGRIDIANFQYLPGDLGRIQAGDPVPRVKLGTDLQVSNAEGAAVIYHTLTTCKFPCMGPASASFPVSDGKTSLGRKLDFDSGELGLGIPTIGPAKQELLWQETITRENGYRPNEVVTYFCRVHPFMRGAFKVVK